MRFKEFKILLEAFVIDVPSSRQEPAVADVQKALQALGYNVGPTGIDGIRGPYTVAAVKQFQQDAGVAVDGDPGPDTVAALNAVLAANPTVANKIAKSTTADVKPVTRSAAQPMLSTDAVTTGLVGKVLNFIARYESGGNYNVVHGGTTAPLTSMTITQVIDYQRQMLAKGHESTAVGRYQYLRDSLLDVVKYMGIDPATKFDERTQDAIATADMRRRCGLDQWLSGTLADAAFLTKLSKVWAGLPNATTGISSYAATGSNKAGTSADVALNTLHDIKTTA